MFFIKRLIDLTKVFSIFVFVASCAQLPAEKYPEKDSDAQVSATQQQLERYVDFSDPFACTASQSIPNQISAPYIEPESIWPSLPRQYGLSEDYNHKRIKSEFNWYFKNPNYLARVSRRAEPYLYYVVDEIKKRELPMELALLPIVESAFDPFAYSHGRASGMWQFIPGTGKRFNLNQDWWYDGRRDVIGSTQAALDYLEYLHKHFKGDWLHALAAYNSGEGTVGRAIRKNRKKGKPTDFWNLKLPRETRSYVPKLLALAQIVKEPARYNVELFPVRNQPFFEVVDTRSQIDLAQAAQMATIDIDDLYRLNPGFNRWATSPSGPHRLLIPVAQAQTFRDAVAKLPSEQRLHWERITVRKGDSLISLAKKFNTDADTIRDINGIRKNMIRVGQKLMIPVASKGSRHYGLSADNRLEKIQQRRTGGSSTRQVFHTVKSGESLWTIAQRYNVRSKRIAHWNGMSPKDYIRPGQKLSIWVPKTTKVSSTASSNRSPIIRKVGYRVRSGDSLARIAGKFNVSVNDILSWNNVSKNKYLQPGQRLTLYVDITNSVN